MTKRQMNIVLGGTLLIVLMGLFPPWEAIERATHPQRRFSGYHFITYSPVGHTARVESEFREKLLDAVNPERRYNHKIYVSILLIQWLCVLLFTSVAYVVSDKFVDIKFKLNPGGRLQSNAAREYLCFLKYIAGGVIALPIIRFSIYWLMANEFNWSTFNITGNLLRYYSDSWGYIFVPYLLFLLIRSIKWARSELKH